MIDWLNEFSLEAVAHIVHPLLVLAVLAMFHAGVGYTVGWPLRMKDKDPDTVGDEFPVFVAVSLIFIAFESALVMVWWILGGVKNSDGLTLVYFASYAVLLAALLTGSFLPHRKWEREIELMEE